MSKNYNIKQVKLIIWDLDETLWNGVLSEGTVIFNLQSLKFIEDAVTKGIMSSICSKNDFEKVKNIFFERQFEKYWNYFIFPSINWQPKGERIKEILAHAGLREENTLFIDDNPANIEEAKFYCPNIMTALPEEIPHIIDELYLVNDYDFEHTRLKQYKILEKKEFDKTSQNISNKEFLHISNIRISIKDDCKNNLDRILKLISRTNQLNFTKKRITSDELLNDINNPDYKSSYVIVEDNYGNYGICGFYTLDTKNNKLVHFLFSCRILSMGIEQFLYSELNYPDIEISGDVAVELNKTDRPDWVHIDENVEIKHEIPFKKVYSTNILFKGTCDLLSAIDYINPEDSNIDTELPYWNKDLVYILNHTHTAYIEMTHKKSFPELLKLTHKFPFPHKDEFKTKFFDCRYNVVVLSLLSNCFSGLYKSKTTDEYAVFGFANCDITDENNWDNVLGEIVENARDKNIEMLKNFKEEFVFAGNPPIEETIKNLKYIRENLSPKTELVLILGSEIPTDKLLRGYENIHLSHQILNRAVEEFAKDYSNITLINLTKFIKSDDDYTNCINHFARKVYIDISKEFIDIINRKTGINCLSLNKNEKILQDTMV